MIMKKALTIEELKNRVGKPVFVAELAYKYKEWRVLSSIGESKLNAFELTDGKSKLNALEFTDGGYIFVKYQEKFRFFDTEVSETELKEILVAEEKEKKKTGYERVGKGKFYYAINSLKEAVPFSDGDFLLCNTENTEKRFKAASYFNDENLAKNIARAEQLKYQLRRFAALNGGIPSQADWKNYYCDKYYIYYDYSDNKIDVCDLSISRDFGQIYFKDIKACKKAIEIFKDELIWYFTEFEEMLY